MSYAYFPGCSAKGSGRSYEESLLAVFGALGTGLDEIKDWNCCGATAYPAVDMAKAFALSARNLALAEDGQPDSEPVDVIAPCAGCYRAAAQDRARTRGRRAGWRTGSAARWRRSGCGTSGPRPGAPSARRARERHRTGPRRRRCRAAARGVAGCLLLRLPARAPVRDVRRPARTDVDGAAAGGGRRRARSTGRCGRAAAAVPATAAVRSSGTLPDATSAPQPPVCWRTRRGAART